MIRVQSLLLLAVAALLLPAPASAQLFADVDWVVGPLDTLRSAVAFDIDGDGDLDVVAGSQGNVPTVAWYENVDLAGPGTGDGTRWSRTTIATGIEDADDIEVADLDADGDLDVVVADSDDGIVRVYLNAAGDGSTWTFTTGMVLANVYALSIEDVDGDGDLDIVGGGVQTPNRVYWAENNDVSGPGTGNATSWTRQTLNTYPTLSVVYGVASGDLDGDGDPDVAALGLNGLWWFDNVDVAGPGSGDGSSWLTTQIDPMYAQRVEIEDVDGDGDLDLVATYNGGTSWFRNEDAAGPGTGDATTWTEFVVSTASYSQGLDVGDVDGDGDLDIYSSAGSGSGDEAHWYRNDLGDGTAWTQLVVDLDFADLYQAQLADLDGDGDLDFLVPSEGHSISWFENVDTTTPGTGDGVALTERFVWGKEVGQHLATGDLDGDGLQDLVGAASGRMAVFFNVGAGSVWTEATLVEATTFDPEDLATADIDGDGDIDVLVAQDTLDSVVWYENPGTGAATGWTENVITATFTDVESIEVFDFDGDGDLDVAAAASTNGSGVRIYENTAGDASTWTEDSLSTGWARDLHSGDVDGDGDLDLVVTVQGNLKVFLQNPSSWSLISLPTGFAAGENGRFADVDGDGDLDVTASGQDAVRWHENTNGLGTAWQYNTLASFPSGTIEWDVYSYDLDGDGDSEVGWAVGGTGQTWTIRESIPGSGFLGYLMSLPGTITISNLHSADLDGDGDHEFIASSQFDGQIVRWVNTLQPPTPDAGGPYVGDEPFTVPLDASASTDDGTIVEYAWDCDGDGTYELTSAAATGTSCSFADDGGYTVGLQLTDDGGLSATTTVAVTVNNLPPTITSTAGTAATEGLLWSYAPMATDPAGVEDPLTWSLAAGAPAAMTVDAGTGVLNWTPAFTDVGSVSVTLTVDDGDGGTASESFTLVVAFLDADADGMPDTWESSYGLDPTVDDSTLDGDGDGLDNLGEWLAGSDPTVYGGPGVATNLQPDVTEVATDLPELTWDAAVDPDGDALTYEVEVYDDTALTTLLASGAALPGLSWTVDTPLPDNADAFWRVRASDPYVAGAWSAWGEFFVNTANDAPTLPAAAAPLTGDAVDTLRPTLSFVEATDIDRDGLVYDLRVFEDDGITLVTEVLGFDASGGAAWEVDVDLVEDSDYLWDLQAVDEHGLGSGFTAQEGFFVSTENGAPAGVTILAPEEGDAFEELDPTITATEAVDPEGDALEYRFELDTTDTFSSQERLDQVLPETGVGAVSWSLAADGVELRAGAVWYARVRAEDPGGAASDWAPTVSFTILDDTGDDDDSGDDDDDSTADDDDSGDDDDTADDDDIADDDDSADEKVGCDGGCSSAGGTAGWFTLLLLPLVRRRR